MALEPIHFQQNPISYASEDYTSNMFMSLENLFNFPQTLDEIACSNFAPPVNEFHHPNNFQNSLEGSPSDGLFNFDPPGGESPPCSHRKKRRTTKIIVEKKEKMENQRMNQRMNHINIERNRRKQVNHYLAILRSMMPSSYAQRGDQASIVGGAINFVKELEQQLQFLEAHKQRKLEAKSCCPSHIFNNFFTFPQYSTCPTQFNSNNLTNTNEQISNVANIEVANLIENHANIKISSRKQPKQLYKMVTSFFSLSLTILHLNVTTSKDMVLYSFNVKVEDDCELTTVNEIATAVHEILEMIQREAHVSA